MIRLRFILLLLLIASWMPAQSNELKILMDSLLAKHPDYQQALSRFEQEKAIYTIEKSLDWFDVNLRYQQYDNDFTRDDIDPVLEHSDVNEKDKRWRIEIAKQLFPKDYDNVTDLVGARINLMRYKHEVELAYSRTSADIFDEMIEWYEAEMMVSLTQAKLEIYYEQNRVLEELDLQNQIEPETLIENIELIDDLEDELYDYKEIAASYSAKYGDILPGFLDDIQNYIKTSANPDTALFQQKVELQTKAMNKEAKKISRKIKFNYFHFFLPEVNLRLSYNWRETRQNWEIEKNSILKNMIRNQDEEFPEGEIELSLPFNLFSNTSGKLALLKAYERELRYRSRDIQLAWQDYYLQRLNFYYAAGLELKRKARLTELYERNLNLQSQKYLNEPTALGNNPELKLQKYRIKKNEAMTEYQIAQMKFYKEIFLINSLGEETK